MTPIAEMIEDVIAHDPRPLVLREWQDQHRDPWIRARLYYRFLYQFAREHRPSIVLELGHDRGYAAANILAGCPGTRIIAVDIAEPVERVKGVELIVNNSILETTIERVADTLKPHRLQPFTGTHFELVLFDSLHTRDHLLAEFRAYDPMLAQGALELFDDVNYSPDMLAAWADLPGPKWRADELHPGYELEGRPMRAPGFGYRFKT